MAALRVAARRLVGGGQAPAVAVEGAQRRLFPRLFQVNRARSTTSSAASAAETNVAAGKGLTHDDRERRVKLLTEIHNRREELYELTAEAERIYNIPGKPGREIRRLRQELSPQVLARPNDSTWRFLRRKSIFERYGGQAACLFSTYVITSMLIGSIVQLEPHEQRWLKKKREESMAKSGGGVSSN